MTTYFGTFDANATGPLGRDERIIWQGKPFSGLLLSGPGLSPIWFGWGFLLFSLYWMYTASESIEKNGSQGLVFTAFGIPFVVIGFYKAIGQYPWNAYTRRNTVYSLTTQRAIIWQSGLGSRGLKSYPITKETQLEFDDLAGGSIWFAKFQSSGRNRNTVTNIGFVGIPDAQGVYRQMLQIQQGTP